MKAHEQGGSALVIVGGASFPFMQETAEILAKALPNGEIRTLEGQSHDVAPAMIVPALKEFFI